MQDTKVVLTIDDITPHGATEKWQEYAVKNAWKQVSKIETLIDYMPDDINRGHYPDRDFFWNICEKIIPKWSKAYQAKVTDYRRRIIPKKKKKATFIAITN